MHFMHGFPVILPFAVCGSELEGCKVLQPALSHMAVLRVCLFHCWILPLERNFLKVFLIFWEEGKGAGREEAVTLPITP